MGPHRKAGVREHGPRRRRETGEGRQEKGNRRGDLLHFEKKSNYNIG
jgi:hypothetical protein